MKNGEETDLELNELLFKLKNFADSLSLQLLIHKYRPMIIKLCRNVHLQSSDADDLLQEARIICYQTACSFDPERSTITFGAYFKLSLQNHYRSLVRRENAQKRQIEKLALSLEELLAKKGDVLATADAYSEKVLDMNILLDKLPTLLTPLELQVFHATLRYPKTSQISLELGLSTSQINNAIHRTHKKLSQWYQENN